MASLPDVEVHDEGREQCGIVTFTKRGEATLEMHSRLHHDGLNVSAPGRRNAQYDLGGRGLDAVLRAAVHYFNTDDEVDRSLELIARL